MTFLTVWFAATAGALVMYATIALCNPRQLALWLIRASAHLFAAGEAIEAASDSYRAAQQRNATALKAAELRLGEE